MTNNEPEFTNLAGIPVQLCFFYDSITHEIVTATSSLDDFFETKTGAGPHFLRQLQSTDPQLLDKEWERCLQLKQNQTRTFSLPGAGAQGSMLLKFIITRPAPGVFATPSLLLISVTKSLHPISAEHKKTAAADDAYAEFIALAAHDLDSPLRKLSILLDRITGKLENTADSDTASYVRRSQACLSDMRGLIDSLTLLARINDEPRKIVSCDLESIVHKSWKSLEAFPGEKKIIMSPGSLPVIEGDVTQYKQLFNSLLENTFKFTRTGTPVEVKILSEVATEKEKQLHSLPTGKTYFKILVADNGIGFKRDQAEKIFQPFIRLNGKSEYKGSGIGLAICKKIVENHCGIIYAESEENFGATFTLFLPLSPY